MGTVVVLTTVRLNWRRLRRRLDRAGYAIFVGTAMVRVSRDGRGVVETTGIDLARLPDRVTRSAWQLLGSPPRDGLTCSFAGPDDDSTERVDPVDSEEWQTVVAIARAVAAEVPLALVDDLAGTTYLVHPGRGLVGPEEYQRGRGTLTSDLLRRLLGG